jgi:hypothetical protein
VLNLMSHSDRRDAISLAAAYTGLNIEHVDGVISLDNKLLLLGGIEKGLDPGTVFAWRGYMNALRL